MNAHARQTLMMIAESNLLPRPAFDPVYTGMIGAAWTHPAVLEALAPDILAPPSAACRKRPQCAYERGQMRPGVELDAVELLYGPIYPRLLLQARPLDADQGTAVLELALREPSRGHGVTGLEAAG